MSDDKYSAIAVVAAAQPLLMLTLTAPEEIGADEVRIRVEYTSINPLDYKLHEVNFFSYPMPCVFGFDVSGEVVAIGSNVSRFAVGDAVFGRAPHSLAQYVVIDHNWVVLRGCIPSSDAGVYGVAYCSAYDALFLSDDISQRKGQTIYIAGAAGGVGHFAVQLARAHGMIVIGSASKPESLALLQQLQCDHIINYSTHNVITEIARITDNNGCDLVFDSTYQPQSLLAAAAVVKRGGVLIKLGSIDAEADRTALELVFSRGAAYDVADLVRYHFEDEWKQRIPNLGEGLSLAVLLYADGRCRPFINKQYEFSCEAVTQAFEDMKAGRVNVGKVSVKVQ